MLKKIFLIFILILIPFSIAFALEVDWPPSPMGTVLTASSTLTNLTQYFYEWGIALGGLAAFIALLIAGFMYLTSVGDPQKMADARGRIVWALAGLVLLLASWLILNTINPDLTTLNLDELSPPCDTANECPDPTKYVCTDKNPGNGKKEGICIFQYVTKCNTVDDCPEPKTDYKCTDKNPGNAEKEGACIEKGKPACSYAIGFATTSFKGGQTLPPAEVDGEGIISSNPGIHSVKSFFDDSTYDKKCWNASSSPVACAVVVDANGNRLCDWNVSKDPKCFQDCGTDACGCRLTLYDAPSCSDEMANNIPAYSSDLSGYRERDGWFDGITDCIRLDPPI